MKKPIWFPAIWTLPFNKGVNDWRDKTLLSGNRNDWSTVTFTYPGTSFQLIKDPTNNWSFPDTLESIDTQEATNYMSSIGNTDGVNFSDSPPSVSTPIYQLTIQTLSSGLIEIKAYPDPANGYLLSSSLNPGAYFTDTDTSLVKKIFVGKDKFQPIPETE